MPEPRSVHVIGAGITGLATAWFLERRAAVTGTPVRVHISESCDRVGGKITTQRIETPSGPILIESAADAMLHTKPWAVDLARALGLAPEFITTNAERRVLSMWDGTRLVPLPAGLHLIVPRRIGTFVRSPLLSLRGRLRNLLEPFVPARRAPGDESMASFVRRRFGHETLDVLATPLMAGIYSADPADLSMAATFPQYIALEQQHGHVSPAIRAAAAPTATSAVSPFTSFRGGMQTMTDALAAAIHAPISLHTAITAVDARRAPVAVHTDNGVTHHDAVVLCIPSTQAAHIVRAAHPAHHTALGSFSTRDSGSVALIYTAASALECFPGYGILIKRSLRSPFSAITIASIKFTDRAPAPVHVLRLFFGPGELFDASDDRVSAAARALVAQVLGLKSEPWQSVVVRWPGGAPQYTVGHRDRVAALRASAPHGVFFAGSPYDGVGIPDCVHSAQNTADAVWDFLSLESTT